MRLPMKVIDSTTTHSAERNRAEPIRCSNGLTASIPISTRAKP